ncbi:MAG TPA: hypothetical protein VNS08_14835 [Ureibacillus sp.]|nr:hypothetical protein [Ureibacillus sp.]
MQKINWDMMTQFVFPEQLGVVEEVLSVDVKPVWQQIETEDSVRLVGIYHIAAIARFNPDEIPEYGDGTYIEELEFEGNNGYFEYALPLEVDLPREKVAYDCSPQVCVNDVSTLIYDGSNCTFKWDVDCQFDEAVEGGLFQYEQQPVEFQQPPMPERPVLQEAIPIADVPDNPEPESPQIEVAPTYEDFLEKEESTYTEEIHFGGTDGIFPEQPQSPEESPTGLTEGQPVAESEFKNDTITQVNFEEKTHESPNLKVDANYDVSDESIIVDIDKQKIVDQKAEIKEIEKVVEANNQYFPTDADDFYNELTESYTILNVSNKIYRD